MIYDLWLFGLVLGCDNEWREKVVLVGECGRRRFECARVRHYVVGLFSLT